MNRLKVLFMGTPDFSVPSLELLADGGFHLVGVVTQPDRPRGRGQKIQAGPVKRAAVERGIAVYQPERVKDREFMDRVAMLKPDLIVTVAFGQILPPRLLGLPPLGAVNLHASLLPAYRGAAPIQRAIMDGAQRTGVTVMCMSPELDAGDIILQAEEPIHLQDTAGDLHERLARKGAVLLVQAVELLAAGKAVKRPQDPSAATYAPPLRPVEERLQWCCSAFTLYNRIRGLNPWPGAYTTVQGRRLKVWSAAPPPFPSAAPGLEPGQVMALEKEGMLVAAGDAAVNLLAVQPEGKRTMTGAAFARGYRITPGERLGC